MQVPLSRPSINDDDVAAVLEVLRSPSLSMGPKVREFERAMAGYVGTAEAVAVNSGTSGLHLCLAAVGIGPGDEVVTSPFSFVASANAALYQGARPVFADIDPHTLTIDPEQVEERLTDRTRALLPVDVFGQPAPIEDMMAIADRQGLRLVRDACEAIGAERNGQRSAQGTPTVFAFYPNKQMTTGEGGVVVTNDVAFAGSLRSMSNQGRDDNGTWMNHVRLGYNYRLDEMSAALGLSQLARLDEILDRRARVAAWYNERLSELDGVQDPYVAPETTRMSWFVYVVRLDERIDRERLMASSGGWHPLAALFRPDPLAAVVPPAVRLQARRLPGDRAGRPDDPGAAVLHRHDRGAGRLRLRPPREAPRVAPRPPESRDDVNLRVGPDETTQHRSTFAGSIRCRMVYCDAGRATAIGLLRRSRPGGLLEGFAASGKFSWTFAGNVVYSGSQWGMLMVLAKLGSPEMVGQFALGLAVTAPVIMFANLQLRGVQATDARREYRFGHYLALRLFTTALAILVITGIVFGRVSTENRPGHPGSRCIESLRIDQRCLIRPLAAPRADGPHRTLDDDQGPPVPIGPGSGGLPDAERLLGSLGLGRGVGDPPYRL